jgi:hypothetical protein
MIDGVKALIREGEKTLTDAQAAIALAKKDIPKIATALWLFIVLQALSLLTTIALITYVVLR